MRVEVRGLSWAVRGRAILRGVDLDAQPGEFVGLLGPNGGGKSTCLRCIYRALRPPAGQVLVGGHDVWALPPRQVARLLAVVTQEHGGECDFTVEEMVRLGRVPHKRSFGRQDQRDDGIVAAALERTQLASFADRPFTTLSGGERQRALIARAVAQQAPVLLLPTNHLDVRAQLHTVRLIRGLGVTVVAVLHDLSLALAACDRVFVLSAGEIAAAGPPDQVLTGQVCIDVVSGGLR